MKSMFYEEYTNKKTNQNLLKVAMELPNIARNKYYWRLRGQISVDKYSQIVHLDKEIKKRQRTFQEELLGNQTYHAPSFDSLMLLLLVLVI